MTDSLLILLAFTQIPIVLVLGTRIGLAQTRHYLIKRNPDWIAAHPEFQIHERIIATATYVSYFLAAGTFLATIKYTIVTPTPDLHGRLLLAPYLIWVLGLMVFAAAFNHNVTKKIPAPTVRRASLSDRRLSAFVPLWTVKLCYGSLALIICIYAWALMNELLDQGLALRRIVGVCGFIIIGSAVLHCFLRRKHSELEDFGFSSGRKIEIIFSLVLLYLGVTVGIWRILGDFFEIFPFGAGTVFVACSLLIQGITLVLSRRVNSLLGHKPDYPHVT